MLQQIHEILPDKRISVFLNHKGGVSKTTSVANIGFSMAAMGYRVLLIDLDSQANLTKNLIDPEKTNARWFADQLFSDDKNIKLLNPRNNLYLIPANLKMSMVEGVIREKIEREMILKNKLQAIVNKKTFDAILLDCPTNPSTVNINALVAADVLVVPILGESFSLEGLNILKEEIQIIRRNLNPRLEIDRFLISRYNPTAGINRDVAQYISEKYPGKVFKTKIRNNLKISEAQLRHMTVMEYLPKSNGAKDYDAVTREFVEYLSGRPLVEEEDNRE